MLDTTQQEIVNLNGGFYKVIATAGAGKSTVLLHRSARLYSQTKSVLCVTFTNEAAKSLRVRCGKSFPHVDTSIFCTLHALALKFAHDYSSAFPFKLADNPLADEGLAASAVYSAIGDKINFKAFTSWVSLQKRNLVSPEEAIQTATDTREKLDYAIGYLRYSKTLKLKGLLDFDDLLYYFALILEQRPDIRSQLQFEYMLLDEAQDLSALDWKLCKLLTSKHKNLFAVGDAGQKIFGWRGASTNHFLRMEDYFVPTKTYYLSTNYRSTPEIVDFGKNAYPYEDIAVKFQAVKPHNLSPEIFGYSTDVREAEETVQKIKTLDPEGCAILARTNQALRIFEEKLFEEGIQYHILGDSGFWELPEIKNVLYYLRMCVSPTDHSILGAIRAPFWPSKYVKKKTVCEKIQTQIKLTGRTAWSILDEIPELRNFKQEAVRCFHFQYLPAKEAVSGMLNFLRVKELYSEEQDVNPYNNPLDNFKELVRTASRYDTLKEFLEFVRKIQGYSKQKKGVTLGTIHAAKGREWDNVWVVSVNRDILPHSKSEDPEEEKCIFFVGVSRAVERLSVSYYGTPSPYLERYVKLPV